MSCARSKNARIAHGNPHQSHRNNRVNGLTGSTNMSLIFEQAVLASSALGHQPFSVMPSISSVFALTCIAMSIETAAFSVPDYNQQIKNLYSSRSVNSKVEVSTIIAPSPSPVVSSESPSLSPSPSSSPWPALESPSPAPVLPSLQGVNISAIPADLLQQFINTTQNQINNAPTHKAVSSHDSSKDRSSSRSRGFAVREGDVGYDGPASGSYSMSGSGSGSGFGHHHTIHMQSTAAPRLVASAATHMLIAFMLPAVLMF